MKTTLTYPQFTEQIPPDEVRAGKYLIRFAQNENDLDAILRLRYEIFNLELGEGLDESAATQRDTDEFDAQCHHLMIVEQQSNRIIGTYRMQTSEMARAGRGFYSHTEFDLSQLPPPVLEDACEIGRACIAREHRNGRVLFLLWKGLALYIKHNAKRYLFGCCSLTTQDPEVGLETLKYLDDQGHMHPDICIPAQPGYECLLPDMQVKTFPKVEIPRLMRIYLNYQARICSAPAIDRLFKTIDFLGLIDVRDLDEKTYQNLMS